MASCLFLSALLEVSLENSSLTCVVSIQRVKAAVLLGARIWLLMKMNVEAPLVPGFRPFAGLTFAAVLVCQSLHFECQHSITLGPKLTYLLLRLRINVSQFGLLDSLIGPGLHGSHVGHRGGVSDFQLMNFVFFAPEFFAEAQVLVLLSLHLELKNLGTSSCGLWRTQHGDGVGGGHGGCGEWNRSEGSTVEN